MQHGGMQILSLLFVQGNLVVWAYQRLLRLCGSLTLVYGLIIWSVFDFGWHSPSSFQLQLSLSTLSLASLWSVASHQFWHPPSGTHFSPLCRLRWHSLHLHVDWPLVALQLGFKALWVITLSLASRHISVSAIKSTLIADTRRPLSLSLSLKLPIHPSCLQLIQRQRHFDQ